MVFLDLVPFLLEANATALVLVEQLRYQSPVEYLMQPFVL